jgi:hypothetical protein
LGEADLAVVDLDVAAIATVAAVPLAARDAKGRSQEAGVRMATGFILSPDC